MYENLVASRELHFSVADTSKPYFSLGMSEKL
jgi:hypothetical protein